MHAHAIAASAPVRRPHHSWPFLAAPSIATTDYGVGVPARQAVIFKDGEEVWLHRVSQGGSPSLFLRQLPDGRVIDLRRLAPSIEQDLPVASTRDVPGIVHYTLRTTFPTAQAFLNAVAAAQEARA